METSDFAMCSLAFVGHRLVIIKSFANKNINIKTRVQTRPTPLEIDIDISTC